MRAWGLRARNFDQNVHLFFFIQYTYISFAIPYTEWRRDDCSVHAQALYNATLLHGLVSPHQEAVTVVKDYLSTHVESSSLRKKLPVWLKGTPGGTLSGNEIPCADGIQTLKLGQPEYGMRQIERCMLSPDTRMLAAALAQIAPVDIDMISDFAGNNALHYAAYHGNEIGAAVAVDVKVIPAPPCIFH